MHTIVLLFLVSLDTFISWQIFRYLLPVSISFRLAPLLVVAFAYGWSYLNHAPSIVIAFAAASLVAVLHKLTDAQGVEPMEVKIPRRNKKSNIVPRTTPVSSEVGRRIPGL